MARRILISFLGTGMYEYCNYFYEDKKVNEVRFIQEAIVKIFCSDWDSNDQIRIFTTKEAYEQHWLDKPEKNIEGLETCFKKLNLKATIKQIFIETGTSKGATPSEIQNGILDIFEKVYEEISENDKIMYDITHAFRFFPMLGLVLLNYSKFLKNVVIEKILYGAFEVLGNPKTDVPHIQMSKRDAPIVDLTYLNALQEWTNGANDFLNFGSITKISKLTQNEIKPILIESKGKNDNAVSIKELSKNLQILIDNITTCRGKEILNGNQIQEIKNAFSILGKTFIKPLNPILNKISDKIKGFEAGENIKNGFFAVQWCIDNGLTQQGLTLLQENIINAVLISENLDYSQEYNRNVVSSCFTIFSEKIEKSKWRGDVSIDTTFTDKILKSDLVIQLSGEFDSLGKYRNDINHAGMKTNARDSKKFDTKLKEAFDNVKNILFPEK